MNKPHPRMSAAAMDLLLHYDWPGNVRELENAVERAMLISHTGEVQPSAFPFQMNAPLSGDDVRTIDDVERRHIERIVTETNWNLSRAARILGIDRTTLYNKLRRYGMR
jgi:transcriptional regulator of acetoin/glycerol metabolism